MTAAQEHSRKRKQPIKDDTTDGVFHRAIDMVMHSDEEGGSIASDTDDAVDEFPEIDAQSDTDEEDSEFEDDDEDEEETDDEGDTESSDEDVHIFPKPKTVISDITGQHKRVYPEIEPEYDSDSSTEDAPNRVGNVPMHWYDDLPHVGYNIDGKKVLRPARGDELDKFLQTVEDPSSWTSAFDKNTQMDKPLTTEELDLIRRLHANEVPDAEYDPYEPMTEWFTGKGKEEIMPLSAAPEPKRRWIPSKWEKQKVMKIVRAIRQGRIVPSKPKATAQQQFYPIWSEASTSHAPPLPAPKPKLPTNSESYNPPEEYLPTEAERKEWESLDPEDRERDYLPQKYSALRLVPGYDRFIKERFNRQLDLYLAPRVQRVKLNIDPQSLIPKLPSPSSLKPFPVYKSLTFSHNDSLARCLSVSPDGAWVISGDDNGVVCLWEVSVGREVKRWKFSSKIGSVEWCPRTDVSYFVVGIEETIYFVIPPNLPSSVYNLTYKLLAPATLPPPPDVPSAVKWTTASSSSWSINSPILTVQLPQTSGLPKQLVWHRRGDYLASVSSGSNLGGVWIHQVTRRHSQAPFKKIRGSVQLVLFHPLKPHFFVATQQYVRIYNLSEQLLLKTLTPGIKWISSMDVHPSGDHVIVGGYDRKLCWFDLELSDKPYKVLRYHTRAIRSLHFHPTYPLFASSSDDGTIQIFHARVYNDLMTDPLIVPLKILRGHQVKDGLGALQVKWCNHHPWLLSGGADGAVNVWCS
ncbi:NUC169 domain-containing protein [Desarmillaria tabescens]|uniref:Ribosome biogenesis protein ERB1 n=1 Tax=Armillaria tabescens TaxID=1929756 RepID=A0AA39NM53_ARMTA|nr:NUC169 domain-containing protein [Desarmillaria tabescens]KAK0468110.1 NUC169 domain-containing protein [Desarmillaria tabescens]